MNDSSSSPCKRGKDPTGHDRYQRQDDAAPRSPVGAATQLLGTRPTRLTTRRGNAAGAPAPAGGTARPDLDCLLLGTTEMTTSTRVRSGRRPDRPYVTPYAARMGNCQDSTAPPVHRVENECHRAEDTDPSQGPRGTAPPTLLQTGRARYRTTRMIAAPPGSRTPTRRRCAAPASSACTPPWPWRCWSRDSHRSPAQAQRRGAGSLSGRIVNQLTREPVGGARIQLVGTNVAIFTDSAGRFGMDRMPSGEVEPRGPRHRLPDGPLAGDAPGGRHHRARLRDGAADGRARHGDGRRRRPSTNWRSETGFDYRRRRGIGYFITRADIDNRQSAIINDLLIIVPGLYSSCGGGVCRRADDGQRAELLAGVVPGRTPCHQCRGPGLPHPDHPRGGGLPQPLRGAAGVPALQSALRRHRHLDEVGRTPDAGPRRVSSPPAGSTAPGRRARASTPRCRTRASRTAR